MREPEAIAPGMLVVGESLIDIVEHQGREPVEHVGGSPANVALGLARLGNAVELRTWFGSDTLGERIRAWLESDGVIISAGSQGADRTSTARALIDATGAADCVFDSSTSHTTFPTLLRPDLLPTSTLAPSVRSGSQARQRPWSCSRSSLRVRVS